VARRRTAAAAESSASGGGVTQQRGRSDLDRGRFSFPFAKVDGRCHSAYNLRHRANSVQLPEHLTQLSDSNFLTRMSYKNTY